MFMPVYIKVVKVNNGFVKHAGKVHVHTLIDGPVHSIALLLSAERYLDPTGRYFRN